MQKDERIEELIENQICISIKKFCELKKINSSTLWRMRKKNKVQSKKIGGRVYIILNKKEALLTKENDLILFWIISYYILKYCGIILQFAIL